MKFIPITVFAVISTKIKKMHYSDAISDAVEIYPFECVTWAAGGLLGGPSNRVSRASEERGGGRGWLVC